jgi:hypothetical protein
VPEPKKEGLAQLLVGPTAGLSDARLRSLTSTDECPRTFVRSADTDCLDSKEALNKPGLRDAVENEVLVDTSTTLNGGDESGETADVRGLGVAEQREEDTA